MTHKHAETTANVLLIAAASVAAYFILRDPGKRRAAWQVAKRYAAGPLAVWGGSLVRDSWRQSGRSRVV